MKHLYVTGTDTGAGKTRVTAALARAALERRHEGGAQPFDIVKLVQTGLTAGQRGDAQEAGESAKCRWRELYRFEAAADPWAAALAAGVQPLGAAHLARQLDGLPRAAILEGSGGAATPLNATESLSDVARLCGCEAVLVVGLRLGCISHALLTLEYLGRRGIEVRAAVLCEAFGPTEPAYRVHVGRAVEPYAPVAGTLAFEPDAPRAIAEDAARVASVFATARAGSEQRSSVARR